MAELSGGCLCGAVRFAASGVETDHNACHCDMCRRWAGSPLLAAHAMAISFEGEEDITVYRSSDWAERAFCRKCGSNLFYRLVETGEHHVPVGAFDDQSAFRLAGEIFVDSKPSGYEFAGDHPRLTEAEFMAKFASS